MENIVHCHRNFFSVKRSALHFVILGLDPRVHAATSAGERGTSEFCAVAALQGHGMDPMVCAASLRSLLRHRMTKRHRSHHRISN